MGYVGSYMWQLRQKAGDMRILTVTVDAVVANEKGEVKLVYAPHVNGWASAGGHAEYGDTWQTAVLHELEEEAGIIAREEDLVPFAAMSGPERIFHYQDGTTQPFTLCFLVRSWEREVEQTDKEEIPETKWVALEEAFRMDLTESTRTLLTTYKKYLETGKFQMVDFR